MSAVRKMYDFNDAAPLPVAATAQETERRLETLRASIRSRAPELVRELLPAARINGHEARIGDAQGVPGESMCIELTGANAGLWKDHATDEGGDLIDLWCMSEGYDRKGPGFMLAVADLEQHLGLANHAPRAFGKVAQVAAQRATVPKTAEPVKVDERTHVYTSADGRTVLAQVIRREMSDGSKRFLQKNAAGEWKSPEVRPLYNLPGVLDAATVVMPEGEKCADALNAKGIPATALMGGAKAPLAKSDLEPLRGKKVILWPDNDDAGRGLMALLAPALRALDCDVRIVAIPDDASPGWDVADAIMEGRDVAVMIAQAKPAAPRLTPGALTLVVDRSLKFLSLRELRAAKPPRWLIDGVLPEGCFACIIGPPASLKSFLVLDFGLRIANGSEWQGREVKQGPVVYIAGEGQAALTNRTVGWTDSKGGSDDAPFLTVPESVAMPTGQLDELLGLIRTLPAPPVLIVLDTLARNFGAGDENSSTDMGAFVRACDRLRQETGAAVLVVHHTGKDVEKGARGSSALTGAADCIIAVKRKGDSLTVINKPPIGKMKDAEEFADIALRAVPFTTDVDGEPVTTLVLIADEPLFAEPGDEGSAPVAQRLGAVEKAVLGYLTKWPGNEHGLTTIHKSLDIEDKAALRSLRSLVAKGLVVETGEDRAKRWAVAR